VDARAASALGVDIIENCEATGIRRNRSGAVEAVETTRGVIKTKKLGVVAAGHSSVIMAMAGVRMPIESYPLQALVSEPVKPVFPGVVMSNTIQAYISQSDKGELVIRAGTDAYTSYSQSGALHITTHTLDASCDLFPMFRRMRMMRNWGGIVDVTPDRSPILGKTPRASTLTADGVRAASKQRQVRRMSLPRRSHATNRTRLPRPSHSSASPLAV
jgi:sarcosine oxidase, subunit beta